MPPPKQRAASGGQVRRKHRVMETIGTGTRGGGIGTDARVGKDHAKDNTGIRRDSPVIQEPDTATHPRIAGNNALPASAAHKKPTKASLPQQHKAARPPLSSIHDRKDSAAANKIDLQEADSVAANNTLPASAAHKKPTKASLPRQHRAARPPLSSTHDRKDSAAANKTDLQEADSAAANKTDLQEADDEIRKLNELGLGEDISYEEYIGYREQLPCKTDIDTSIILNSLQLKELDARHALYRIRYFKLSHQVSENELCYDKLKEEFPLSLLEEENFFKRFEKDGTLDWFFHPDYRQLAALDDYQRLVPRNYGGHEYAKWDVYHEHFYSYEVEQEYIKFCEELSNKLKWIEAYVPDETPPHKWRRIFTRGIYQAIKIAATGFSKITKGLALSGFYEWLDDMSLDVYWYNEFDGVYYEIWQRVTKQKKSFRDALDEVYKLNKFPLRQRRMKAALGNDTYCSNLKKEFLACTACLTKEVTEDKARELIAEALRKEMEKPKFYAQYCRKKIDIARAIGLVSRVLS